MANMTIQYVIAKHATANPSNLLAPDGGEHIYNIKIATDTDNGCLIAPDFVGDMESYDVFNEAAVTGFSGTVVEKMPNGNWLVLVAEPGNACLVYQTPIAAEEWTNNWKKESNMYNKAGDIVRCYALHAGDRFEVSAEAFSGTPAVGGKISDVTGKKMVVTGGGTGGQAVVGTAIVGQDVAG